MMYTVIYTDEWNEKKWKKTNDIETAKEYGEQMSDNDYDICVPLYEYERLKKQMERMEETFAKIKNMCG